MADGTKLEFASAHAIGWGSSPRFLSSSEHRLFGIATGFGGFCDGADAAEIALQACSDFAAEAPTSLGEESTLAKALMRANERVREAAAQPFQNEEERIQSQSHIGHGCSVALIRFTPEAVVLANAGDSSLYLFHHEKQMFEPPLDLRLQRLNAPHVTKRTLPGKENTSRLRDLITSAIGLRERVMIDTHRVPLTRGDLFVVCTSDVTARVDHEALRGLLAESEDQPLENVARQIISACGFEGELKDPHQDARRLREAGRAGVAVLRVL